MLRAFDPVEQLRGLARGWLRRGGWGLALVVAGFLAGRLTAGGGTAVAERTELDAQIEALETNLTQGRALVASQELLKARHQQVTELACASTQEHWGEMTRLAMRQEKRLAEWRAERAGRAPGRRLARAPTATPAVLEPEPDVVP